MRAQEPYVGEIRLFAGNFAPQGWAFCDGQLLAVSQNDALFSLLGTTYGGDGETTFGLPDLRGRVPLHVGSGPGLSPRSLGAKGGAEKVTLTVNQMPSHTHSLGATGGGPSAPPGVTPGYLAPDTQIGSPEVTLRPASGLPASPEVVGQVGDDAVAGGTTRTGAAGASRSHTNIQPFINLHYIIALVGIYPSP